MMTPPRKQLKIFQNRVKSGRDMKAGEHSSDCGGFIHALPFFVRRWEKQFHDRHGPTRGPLDPQRQIWARAPPTAKDCVEINMVHVQRFRQFSLI